MYNCYVDKTELMTSYSLTYKPSKIYYFLVILKKNIYQLYNKIIVSKSNDGLSTSSSNQSKHIFLSYYDKHSVMQLSNLMN